MRETAMLFWEQGQVIMLYGGIALQLNLVEFRKQTTEHITELGMT